MSAHLFHCVALCAFVLFPLSIYVSLLIITDASSKPHMRASKPHLPSNMRAQSRIWELQSRIWHQMICCCCGKPDDVEWAIARDSQRFQNINSYNSLYIYIYIYIYIPQTVLARRDPGGGNRMSGGSGTPPESPGDVSRPKMCIWRSGGPHFRFPTAAGPDGLSDRRNTHQTVYLNLRYTYKTNAKINISMV